MVWQRPENIDKHPLRYSGLQAAIERILLRRLHAKELDGYTLETSLEIADAVQQFDHPKPR